MQADIINKICEPNKDNPIIQEAVGCLEFYDYQLKRIVNRKKCLKGEDAPDPDKDSKTLRLLHQVLWSKKISPKNEMILTQDLKWRDFSFGSDTIINGFIWPEKYEKKLQEFYEVKGESFFDDMREFTLYVYTIGGFLVFPTHGQSASINKRRGTDPEIQDRFDSTLECIQKFYLGQENPLSDILNVDKCFFDLFGYGEKGFRKYVDFFFLQDLVSKDYKTIQYFLPKGKGVLPQNFEDYYTYRHNCIEFIKKRNERIAQELKKILNEKV